MPRPNFFNDNINRTFPFRVGTAGVDTPLSGLPTMRQLPDDFIADCGFVLGPETDFVEGVHSIFLYKISRVSESQIDFEFRSNSPAMIDSTLIFHRDTADPLYTSEFIESDILNPFPASQSLSLSESIPMTECGEPVWSGYLVTGRIDKIVSRMEISDIITGSEGDAIVEPALLQNQNQLVSLNIGNADRIRAVRPADCPPNIWNFPTNVIYINGECLQGDIKLRAGYNITLGHDILNNAIKFTAVINEGKGEPCEQIKLFPSESPPIGSSNNLLAGDYYCNEVLRTVNGLAGPSLTIFAGTGVAITPENNSNTLIIDINLRDLSLCDYYTESESV